MASITSHRLAVLAIDSDGDIRREHVERVLDCFIAMELRDDPDHHRDVIEHGNKILRKYGQQLYAVGQFAHMQAIYYSYTNSAKYLQSAEVSTIARHTLSNAWDGIGEWRD